MPLDIKKLITGFLILAAVVSPLVFLLSDLAGGDATAQNQKQNDRTNPSTQLGASKVPENVFVEPIPAASTPSKNETDDGLPPISNSGNLTDRLAEKLTRDMVKANPNGPGQDAGGQLSAKIPELDSAIEKTLSSKTLEGQLAGGWGIKISDSDLNVVKGSGSASAEDYLLSLDKVLNNLNGSKIVQTVETTPDSQYSPEAVNALSLALEQADVDLKKLSVPESFLGFHKSLLTLLSYQKKAVAAVTSEDPLGGALEMQNEENNYNLALASFQNESGKINSIIKDSSLKEDASSLLGDLFGIKPAHAFIWVPVNDFIGHKISLVRKWIEKVWKYLKILALQYIKNQLVHRIMAQTLNWIQGGGKPQFITNWRGFLKKAGNEAAGIAIQNVVPGLCRSIGPLIQLNLNRAYLTEPPPVTCTLDEVVQNVKNFYTNFAEGGWVGYGAMVLPNGNYFGNLFATSEKIDQEKAIAASTAQANGQSGNGFLSNKQCVAYAARSPFDDCMAECDANNVGPGVPPPAECYASCQLLSSVKPCVEWEDTTPGKVAGDAVANAIGGPLHNIVNASDIVGVVSAFVDSMINKLFLNGTKGLLYLVMKSKITGREADPPDIVTPPPPEPTEPPVPDEPPPGGPPPAPPGGGSSCLPNCVWAWLPAGGPPMRPGTDWQSVFFTTIGRSVGQPANDYATVLGGAFPCNPPPGVTLTGINQQCSGGPRGRVFVPSDVDSNGDGTGWFMQDVDVLAPGP